MNVLTVCTLTSHVLTLEAHFTKSRMFFLFSLEHVEGDPDQTAPISAV